MQKEGLWSWCAGIVQNVQGVQRVVHVQGCGGVQYKLEHCCLCRGAEVQKGACALHIVQECRGAAGGRAVQLMCRHCLLGASHPGPRSAQPLHWAGPTQSQLFTSILFNIGFIDFGYMGRSETLTRITSAKYKKQKVIFRDICDIPTRLL